LKAGEDFGQDGEGFSVDVKGRCSRGTRGGRVGRASKLVCRRSRVVGMGSVGRRSRVGRIGREKGGSRSLEAWIKGRRRR
jgi:hypothetical protein